MAQQFTVRLKNEPGALADLAEALGSHGIDIRTVAAAAVGSTGCAVLLTSNDAAARDVLRQSKYAFLESEALTLSVEDRPGALAHLTRGLADAGVNIVGLLTLGRRQGKAELALSVDEVEKARRVLATN
jgi:hypothetical protein